MNKWRKERNFRRVKNSDETTTYIITVDKQDVEVSREIYAEYAKGARKMEYMEQDLKRSRTLKNSSSVNPILNKLGKTIISPEREISLDKLIDDNWDYSSSTPTPEVNVINRLGSEALHKAIDSLKPEEHQLIYSLYFEEMTEREYSKMSGIARKTINDRKHRILKKLKKLL